MTPEQEMKQRRTSYLIATDQRIPNRSGYNPSNFPYDTHHEQQQKLRSTPHNQTQAIKKLKNFFGEGVSEIV